MFSLKPSKEVHKEFEDLCRPLNDWLQSNCCPFTRIIIEADNAEVVSGEMCARFKIHGEPSCDNCANQKEGKCQVPLEKCLADAKITSPEILHKMHGWCFSHKTATKEAAK